MAQLNGGDFVPQAYIRDAFDAAHRIVKHDMGSEADRLNACRLLIEYGGVEHPYYRVDDAEPELEA